MKVRLHLVLLAFLALVAYLVIHLTDKDDASPLSGNHTGRRLVDGTPHSVDTGVPRSQRASIDPNVKEQSTEARVTLKQGTPLLEWREVERSFANDFLVSDDHLNGFKEHIYNVDFTLVVGTGTYRRRLSLREWDEGKWKMLLDEAGIDPVIQSRVNAGLAALRADYVALLEPLVDSAAALYVDALSRYYELRMYKKSRVDEPNGLPADYWSSARGRYTTYFSGEHSGWKIWVAFGSADFPELELVLDEITRIGQEFTTDVIVQLL